VHTSPTELPNQAALTLLKQQQPLLDVRAPGEFQLGRLPNSFNAPILSDEERAQVGTTYKQDGHDAAVALGHRLVSGEIREKRVAAWQAYCQANPDALIMCWRGGQRSGLAQQWLGEAGLIREKVPGGFKALRSTCLQVLDTPRKKWWLLSGRTGSAKTVLIQTLPQSVDLEGLANHRGSAFGRRLTPQPTPVTFENALAVDYLNHSFESLIVEDESRTIGRIGLPPAWHAQMQQAPIALVEATLEERIEHIHAEYVQDARLEYAAAGLPETELQTRYEDAVLRIKRRLGGMRLTELTHLIQQAFSHQCDHRDWIRYLLTEYYDPMYDFQLQRKADRVQFRGSRQDVQAFLLERP
jgi:tRNA 2-selenouridine synthase